MSPTLIAELLIKFGPLAFDLIEKLVDVWQKPALTPDEVRALVTSMRKSEDAYVQAELAKRAVSSST